MGQTQPIAFSSILRRYRTEAGLTQEALAERAGLSARAISDLERGVMTHPRPFTVSQLAEALELSPEQQGQFEQSARVAATSASGIAVATEGTFLGALPAAH